MIMPSVVLMVDEKVDQLLGRSFNELLLLRGHYVGINAYTRIYCYTHVIYICM